MKTYTKEQIVEAFKSALPNSTALGRLLTHLEPLCGARNTSAGCSEVACTRTAGHTDTIPGVAQERHYNHERRVNWPAFKVGNRVRERRLGRYGFVSRVCDNGLLDVKLDSPKFQYELFQPNELEHIEAPMPQFKVGDRVRIENCPGYLQGELGCIHKVVSASEYLVRCDNGSFPSVHASWVKPAPQFKDGQRVRVRATGQVARIGAVLADGRFMVEGSAYGAVGLEPAPFKVGDRVRWKLSSSLPFCHGQVEYLSDERAGVQTDGQFVEVAERLLEAEPDPAFRVGDRVEVLATGSKGRVIKGQVASGLIAVMMESSVILYLDSKKIKFLEADLISWKEWRRV